MSYCQCCNDFGKHHKVRAIVIYVFGLRERKTEKIVGTTGIRDKINTKVINLYLEAKRFA